MNRKYQIYSRNIGVGYIVGNVSCKPSKHRTGEHYQTKGADYMSRAGSVEDDGSAWSYMSRVSPTAAKFRSCRVKKWLHQRECIKCSYSR